MAVWTVRSVDELAGHRVLAPERYDPRRNTLSAASGTAEGLPLGMVACSIRKTVAPPASDVGKCIVLDTSDAREGVIIAQKLPVSGSAIGSTKKSVKPNDVVISRLRPYLRQVAFVDAAVVNWSTGTVLLCSTEFFVLRSTDGQPISFLVPFLLSEPVQKVLAASQEGGHHPRFDESTLLGLPVPQALLERRAETSAVIERSIALYREAEQSIARSVAAAAGCFPPLAGH